ncbi:hypothetical protein ONZ43_g4615 [Nemania bipapillata]|uniref:Uncharacterized protein n=1 Tax=Nemania bipapillata TaxID=110536 RepID=A0ACC2IKG3_9PEZI|nr:hypothetical protein ONZ43_g4615 [Nemania bipapillata]
MELHAKEQSEFESSAVTSLNSNNEDIETCKTSAEKDRLDNNVVDWNGPDDPENPLRWSKSKKNAHIVIVSIFALVANLAATMFAPGAAQLAKDFHITNTIIQTFTVNIYLLAFSVGPLFLAPLSEIYGRLVIYHVCNLLYIAFTIGCAFSTNVSMFLAFRVLSGLVVSGPLSIGGGTIADLTTQAERGKAVALWGVGPLLGPVAGPIIGGFVTQNVGWRWTFRIILILAGLQGAVSFIFMRETNATVLLRRKTARLIKETGNSKLIPKSATNEMPKKVFAKAIAEVYGWTAEYRVHWIVPIIGTFIIGFGSLFVVIPAQTYLVDAFGSEASASALAANLIIRTPFGALLALAAPPLYAQLGLGWGNSVLGFIALVFTPVPWLFYRYGEKLRNRFSVNL